MKRVLGILLAALMAFSLLASCSSAADKSAGATPTPQDSAATPLASETSGEPKHGGTFYYCPGSDGPSTFGYPWNQNIGFSSVTEPFVGYLTAQWPDGSIRLDHVKSYTEPVYDEAKKLYYIDYELYDNIYLQPHELNKAEPVNADLVIWNSHMMKEKAYWPATLQEIEKTGEFTFRCWHTKISNSTPLMHGAGWMCSKELYEKFGEAYMDEHPISSGPYIVTENVPGSHVTFVRNENYFQKDKPYYDKVQIVYLGEPQMQNIALEAEGEGRLDAVATNTAEQAGLFKDKGYHIMSLANQTITFVMSNQLPADHPLMNMKVRQAISMAVDREAICKALGYGVHTPALQHIPPNFAGHVDDANYGVPAYNPEKAKELMAEAGYKDGFDLKLLPAIGSVTENQAVAIASYLEAIGIRCTLDIKDGTELQKMIRETGWGEELYIGNYISWFTSEDSAAANFRHTEGALPQWKDLVPSQEVLDMITAMAKVGDNSVETRAMTDYVINNLNLIPLWYQGRYHIVNPRVGGYDAKDHMLFFDKIYQKD